MKFENLNTMLASVAVLALLVIAWRVCSLPTNRYQLQFGSYDVTNLDNGALIKESMLFRIDTETGKTFQYNELIGGVKSANKQFWTSIPEPKSPVQ